MLTIRYSVHLWCSTGRTGIKHRKYVYWPIEIEFDCPSIADTLCCREFHTYYVHFEFFHNRTYVHDLLPVIPCGTYCQVCAILSSSLSSRVWGCALRETFRKSRRHESLAPRCVCLRYCRAEEGAAFFLNVILLVDWAYGLFFQSCWRPYHRGRGIETKQYKISRATCAMYSSQPLVHKKSPINSLSKYNEAHFSRDGQKKWENTMSLATSVTLNPAFFAVEHDFWRSTIVVASLERWAFHVLFIHIRCLVGYLFTWTD